LFSQVRRSASAQQLKLTTRVVSIGVTQLDDAHAQLLVFLDQSATRGDTGQTSTSAAQLSISARLIAGHWMIDNIHAR
jgi:Mce-associated membrane protein